MKNTIFCFLASTVLAAGILITPGPHSEKAGAQTHNAKQRALASCRRKYGSKAYRVRYSKGRYKCVLRRATKRKRPKPKTNLSRAEQENRIREWCRKAHPGNVGYRAVKRNGKWWCLMRH